MQNGYAVETKDLTKVFGKFTALDKLNLRIEAGVIHGLLGPNGAGKTTAIKVLCGVLKPTSGEACIFGKKVPDRSILPQIGYMPQETALYLDLSTITWRCMASYTACPQGGLQRGRRNCCGLSPWRSGKTLLWRI
jgi:ABC-type multidrug transport system ATPase subunit